MGSKTKLVWLVAFVLLLVLNVTDALTNPTFFNWLWVVIVGLCTLASYSEWNTSRSVK